MQSVTGHQRTTTYMGVAWYHYNALLQHVQHWGTERHLQPTTSLQHHAPSPRGHLQNTASYPSSITWASSQSRWCRRSDHNPSRMRPSYVPHLSAIHQRSIKTSITCPSEARTPIVAASGRGLTWLQRSEGRRSRSLATRVWKVIPSRRAVDKKRRTARAPAPGVGEGWTTVQRATRERGQFGDNVKWEE